MKEDLAIEVNCYPIIQYLTIDICCICTYAYFYWCTHDFGHAYVDTYGHFSPMVFLSFQNFSGSYNFIMFKNLLLYL